MTRAMAAMIRCDFKSAFAYNHLSVTLLPILLLYLLFRVYRYEKGEEFRFAWWEIVFLLISFIICVLYGVLRNPPLAEKLAPLYSFITEITETKVSMK